jgi:hypothetical protein
MWKVRHCESNGRIGWETSSRGRFATPAANHCTQVTPRALDWKQRRASSRFRRMLMKRVTGAQAKIMAIGEKPAFAGSLGSSQSLTLVTGPTALKPAEEAKAELAATTKTLAERTAELTATREKFHSQVALLARVLTGVAGVERVLAASAPDAEPAQLPDGCIVPGLTSAGASAAKQAAKAAGQELARVQQRTLTKAASLGGGAAAAAAAAAAAEGGEHDELAPFQQLVGVLHHTMDRAAGVAAAAGLQLTSPVEDQASPLSLSCVCEGKFDGGKHASRSAPPRKVHTHTHTHTRALSPGWLTGLSRYRRYWLPHPWESRQ